MRSLPILLAGILLAAPGHADDSALWEARITALEGEVVIFPAGTEDGIHAEAGTPLEAGDRIETGAKSRVEIALEAESILDLGPNTRLGVESLLQEESVFGLEFGLLVAKIKTLVAHRNRLAIRTPTAVAAVRGTEFAVEVDGEGSAHIGVFDEGKVAVRASADESAEEAILQPQEEARVPKGRSRFAVGRLNRFKAHRERLKRLRARRLHLLRNWKRLPPDARAKMRREWKSRFAEKLKSLSPAQRQKLQERLNHRKREILRRVGERRNRRKIRNKIKKNFKKRGGGRRGR